MYRANKNSDSRRICYVNSSNENRRELFSNARLQHPGMGCASDNAYGERSRRSTSIFRVFREAEATYLPNVYLHTTSFRSGFSAFRNAFRISGNVLLFRAPSLSLSLSLSFSLFFSYIFSGKIRAGRTFTRPLLFPLYRFEPFSPIYSIFSRTVTDTFNYVPQLTSIPSRRSAISTPLLVCEHLL